MTPEMHKALLAVGRPLTFHDGEILREKGAFAPDMVLILSGSVNCILSDQDTVDLTVGPGTIVGEIGFLTGRAATATLRAAGPVEALSLDGRALQRLQQEAPKVASEVLRHMAQLLQARSLENKSMLADQSDEDSGSIFVTRCSTLDQIHSAQRVHYDVHCLENGLDSAKADHEEGVIADDQKGESATFIAFTGVQAIGMMRIQSGTGYCGVLQRIHGPLLTDTCTVITTTAIKSAFTSSDVFDGFINAIRTYAASTGSDMLFVHCDGKEETNFKKQGFVRSNISEPGPTVSLNLRV